MNKNERTMRDLLFALLLEMEGYPDIHTCYRDRVSWHVRISRVLQETAPIKTRLRASQKERDIK